MLVYLFVLFVRIVLVQYSTYMYVLYVKDTYTIAQLKRIVRIFARIYIQNTYEYVQVWTYSVLMRIKYTRYVHHC